MGAEHVHHREERTKQTEDGEEEQPMPHVETVVDVADIDAMLDRIEEVLAENAEEFVANFRQENGQ